MKWSRVKWDPVHRNYRSIGILGPALPRVQLSRTKALKVNSHFVRWCAGHFDEGEFTALATKGKQHVHTHLLVFCKDRETLVTVLNERVDMLCNQIEVDYRTFAETLFDMVKDAASDYDPYIDAALDEGEDDCPSPVSPNVDRSMKYFCTTFLKAWTMATGQTEWYSVPLSCPVRKIATRALDVEYKSRKTTLWTQSCSMDDISETICALYQDSNICLGKSE